MWPGIFFFLAVTVVSGFVPPPPPKELSSIPSSVDQNDPDPLMCPISEIAQSSEERELKHGDEGNKLPFPNGEENRSKHSKLNLVGKAFLEEEPPTMPPRPMFNVTHKVFFDMRHGDKDLDRIVFGLFGDVAPKTVENFRQIATVGINGKTYAGTKILRVINKFLIWGGDIVNNDGTGSISIYGKTFEDETHDVKFWAPGFLMMANDGPNTNGCQFYITTTATSWLDDRYVGFGKAIAGLRTVVLLEKAEAGKRGIPVVPITIVKCGELPLDAPHGF